MFSNGFLSDIKFNDLSTSKCLIEFDKNNSYLDYFGFFRCEIFKITYKGSSNFCALSKLRKTLRDKILEGEVLLAPSEYEEIKRMSFK